MDSHRPGWLRGLAGYEEGDRSAQNGTVRLEGEWGSGTFRLQGARFSCGPMQTWPRWPNPSIVETIALQTVIPTAPVLLWRMG